jgi:hypothetical protein
MRGDWVLGLTPRVGLRRPTLQLRICAAPTALLLFGIGVPTLAGWANLLRASGAGYRVPIGEGKSDRLGECGDDFLLIS